MALPLPCTPSALLAANPCFACLSDKELLAVIVLGLAQVDPTYASNLPQLLVDSAEWVTAGKKQMLQSVATLFAKTTLDGQTVDEIKAQIKCVRCSSDKQLQAAFMLVLCETIGQAVPS